MNEKAIVSSKGQIVIPKLLRKKLGLHQSSELILNLRKDKVLELRAITKNIQDFFGQGAKKTGVISYKVIDIDASIEKAVSENDRG